MKKTATYASLIFLAGSMILFWIGRPSVLITIVIGLFIAFGIFVVKNILRIRKPIVILLLIISLISATFSVKSISSKVLQSDNKKMTQKVEEKEEYNDEVMETPLPEETEEPQELEEVKEDEIQKEVITKEVIKEIPVERQVVKQVVKEVPVEKQVVKEVVKEVPVQKETIVETPAAQKPESTKVPKVDPAPTPKPTPKPNYNYTGDPTNGYSDGYNYNYTGDPTGGYGNYTSSKPKISGQTVVKQGKRYSYTISGVNRVSESNLSVPYNVKVESISGNKVTLYFEEGFTGTASIGYGSAVINIDVEC